MKGLIINHETRYIGYVIKLFDHLPDVINYRNFTPEKAEEYDYIILTGGPTIDKNFDYVKKEKEWLLKTEKPVLGICLGFQIICHTFGCEMKRLSKNKKVNENFSFLNENYNMLYNHSYYFDRIPDEFIGEINNNVVTWIKHKNKPILAFQGHPEATENGVKIKEFFLNKIIKKQ